MLARICKYRTDTDLNFLSSTRKQPDKCRAVRGWQAMQAWRGQVICNWEPNGTPWWLSQWQPRSGRHTELASIPRNAIPRISIQRSRLRSHRRVEFTHKSRVTSLILWLVSRAWKAMRLTSSSSGNLNQSTRENYTFRCLLCNYLSRYVMSTPVARINEVKACKNSDIVTKPCKVIIILRIRNLIMTSAKYVGN